MTYRSPAVRRSNRVMIVLVVITIIVVAFWAVDGGFEEIPPTSQESAVVNQ